MRKKLSFYVQQLLGMIQVMEIMVTGMSNMIYNFMHNLCHLRLFVLYVSIILLVAVCRIDGDSDTVPTTLTLELEAQCSHIVEVEVHTGTVTYSDTSNNIYVSFNVTDSWTTKELFHDGSDTGDVEIKTYGLEGNPTQIEFSIEDNGIIVCQIECLTMTRSCVSLYFRSLSDVI